MVRKFFKQPLGVDSPIIRKHLNADALFAALRKEFEKVPDHRATNGSIPLGDALMSGFAVFSLKHPSLLDFDRRRQSGDPNLMRVFGIQKVPCDSQMREILDPVDPQALRKPFRAVFSRLQRGKALEQLTFLDGHYLVSGDGTGFFYSTKLNNDKCLTKDSRTAGKVYHQMFYGAALVHPDYREVIPFAPEFITKQDGETKNDCEREASKRFLSKFRKEHPHLPVILVEDALASNGPHIRELQTHDMRFILGVKEDDHAHLFEKAFEAEMAGLAKNIHMADPVDPRKRHNLFFVNNLPLNKANPDIRVNLLEYWEITLDKQGCEIKGKQKHFSWVTDIQIVEENVFDIMRAGRARWKIENETFNTLKNQGYHLEHNYGLGKENLSLVFVTLMLLAFLVDQTQQLCCGLYRAALTKCQIKAGLFEAVRSAFLPFLEWHIDSMQTILEAICFGRQAAELRRKTLHGD
jgi:hypothetical protein